MNHRRQKIAILISSAAAFTFGIHHLINRQQIASFDNEINSNKLLPKQIELQLNLRDDLLKNNDGNEYIQSNFTGLLISAHYAQALHYLKQIRSPNSHVRERGLSNLAKLNNLPIEYYSTIGQQLDFPSSVKLARTYEGNSNLFPHGPPFIFSIGKKKVLATDKIEKFNDDDILLHTITQFLDKIIDEKKRPLDILSHHYLKLLKSYLDDLNSQTVFDLVQHFESEHADMSSRGIKRYRSNLELYSTFLYALRGYADRYPLDVIHLNGLQILKYLYEKRKDNVSFVRFIGKILVLLSRDQRTHDAFRAVGWLRILHEMSIDKNNIVYSLLASTILANLDRPSEESPTMSEEKIKLNANIKPLDLPTEITNIELTQAEHKVEEKKEEIIDKNRPVRKKPNIVDKFLRRVWYTRSVTDEGDLIDDVENSQPTDENIQKENIVPDIDTSHSVNIENIQVLQQDNSVPVVSWINDQVYGDKIILFSPTMYDVTKFDPDARWNQDPIIDVIFCHGLAGSAFKTWRQESSHSPIKPAEPSTLSLSEEDEKEEQGRETATINDEDSDEIIDIGEETKWDDSKTDIPIPKENPNDEQLSTCWPKDWLGNDVSTSHVRILAVDYESRVSEWQIESLPRNVIRRSMHDRAQEIAEQLKQAGVGKRPIIWVTHSMGGLLAKYILTNEENEEIRSNTRACVFFSVPHFGAELASFGIRHAFFVRPTVEIEELQPNSKNLLNLHERFLEILKTHDNIKILSFAENEKTTFSLRYQTVVVPSESSQINIGKFFILNKNHIYICKPNSQRNFEYQELLELVQTIYLERKNELKTEQIKATEDFLNNLYTFSSPIEDDMQ